jgi:hypothetical protein
LGIDSLSARRNTAGRLLDLPDLVCIIPVAIAGHFALHASKLALG